MSKPILYKKHVITKQNNLNEFRPKDMTMQELRFFTIYLSKINPMDESTRLVRFSLEDFRALMEFESKIKVDYMQRVTDSLLSKVINVPIESGGYKGFQLFKECTVSQDNGEWYVEINAHDLALPLMFNLKGHFFKYELWNTLRLKSRNQLRMYEVLKQYEKAGHRIITVKELREQLGIDENEYSRFGNFKIYVLDSCQEALAEHTDISYTYESYGKKGLGGKILQLKFTITKNKDYTDPLDLHKFIRTTISTGNDIDLDDVNEDGTVRSTGYPAIYEERIAHLRGACNHEFSREEIIMLYDMMVGVVPHLHTDKWKSYGYLQRKYRELEMRSKTGGVGNRFGYMKSLVKAGD